MPALTKKQLIERTFSIGGSDAAAACGISPYKTPLELYMEKAGISQPKDISSNDAVYWGSRLEQVIAEEYVRRTGSMVEFPEETFYHPTHSFLSAHIDGRMTGLKKLLECKTAGAFNRDGWGEEKTDDVPLHYIVQVQHYMGITGDESCDLAVLIGGQDYRIYQIARDQELITNLIQALKIFWLRIENKNPPDPTNNDDLKLIYGIDNGKAIESNSDVAEIHASLKTLKKKIKKNEEVKLELEFALKKFMNHNTILLDTNNSKPLATWKVQDNNRFQVNDFREIHPDLAKQFTFNKPTRVLRIK